MRLCACALLLAACSSRPYIPFDGGYDVHFILVAAGKPLKVRPICTVGSLVGRAQAQTLRSAAEVATLRVPRGDHRISVWEPRQRAGGRASIEVERDLWVVMEVVRGEADTRLEVFDKPPSDRLAGGWKPLVAVPN